MHASSLGFHEYDGRISEFTRLAIDAEFSRLTRFVERLKRFNPAQLSPGSAIDLRLMQTAIKRELFFSKELGIYEHNPIIYAAAIDVNVFARRRYAPIEDRVRSITAVENQATNIIIAAKTNLVDVLPRPQVELAIQIARDSADFLKKNLGETLVDFKDDNLRAGFLQSNRRAATALTDYAAWLERERLPKATPQFAIGREKYQRFLVQTEMIDLPLQQILELGEAELKHEQEAFADAAKRIDPEKPAADVFKKIQSEHPAPENLLAEAGKAMESIRKYVVDQKLVTIPTEVRPQIKEAPPYFRSISLVAMDAPGPFDKRAVDAFFYVASPEKEWSDQSKQDWLSALNNYTLSVLAMGETYPGRYVQLLHLNGSKASKPQKIFPAASFVHGWDTLLREGHSRRWISE